MLDNISQDFAENAWKNSGLLDLVVDIVIGEVGFYDLTEWINLKWIEKSYRGTWVVPLAFFMPWLNN